MAGLAPDLLRQLAHVRLAEAHALLDAGHNAGAWYVAGYVLELALKTVICRTLQLPEYPETALGGKLKTHSTDDLVLLAGLKQELAAQLIRPEFKDRWETVDDWKVDDRYSLKRTKQNVLDLLDAYEHPAHGVLIWLTSRW